MTWTDVPHTLIMCDGDNAICDTSLKIPLPKSLAWEQATHLGWTRPEHLPGIYSPRARHYCPKHPQEQI